MFFSCLEVAFPPPRVPQYFRKKKTLLRHLAKCTLRHPPGDEIYRSPPPPPNDPGLQLQ